MSRSPAGAWLNASRMIEHWIGIIIIATTMPTMNVDALYHVLLSSGLEG